MLISSENVYDDTTVVGSDHEETPRKGLPISLDAAGSTDSDVAVLINDTPNKRSFEGEIKEPTVEEPEAKRVKSA